MKTRLLFVVAALLALVGGPVLAADDEVDYEQEGERRAVTAGAELIGRSLPSIELKTIDGATIDLSAFRGKRPVYLKFWATWCAPCLKQMPDFNAIHAELGDEIEVIALNTGFNDDLQAVQRYREQLAMPMPIVIDDGRLARALNLRVTPQHLVVGRDGRIMHVGHLDDETLHAALRKAIAQSAASMDGVVESAVPSVTAFKPGDPVKGLNVRTLDGRTLALGGRAGQPQAVVFTAAWCEWYVAEKRPETSQACERVRKQVDELAGSASGIEWLTVASDLWTTGQDLQEYADSNALRTPIALDEGGKLFAAFGVRSVPSVALIDAAGRLVRVLGPEEADLAAAVAELKRINAR